LSLHSNVGLNHSEVTVTLHEGLYAFLLAKVITWGISQPFTKVKGQILMNTLELLWYACLTVTKMVEV
jgi:hypothetical protein